jgi:hypothetical protein
MVNAVGDDLIPIPQPVTTGLDASIPWVGDKAYKLTFFKGAQH